MKLSCNLSENIAAFRRLLPLDKSFDFITRELSLGNTPCYFIGLNGLCDLETMEKLFADIEAPDFKAGASAHTDNLPRFVKDQFLYAQISFSDSVDEMVKTLLCGPCLLLLEGYAQALIIDSRKYPTRSTEEPGTEKVVEGAKDGFIESLLTNCNLIRRRLRTPGLTFALHQIGDISSTDVAVAYLQHHCDHSLLRQVEEKLDSIRASALTMGIQSLKELLLKKSIFHPLPSFFLTARPDVACSYLAEGYILVLVDNSPFALVLPCNLFQFTQNPDDYYKAPIVGTYVRLVRFVCLILSLLLLPLFLYFSFNSELLPQALKKIAPGEITPLALFIYVLFIELGLDLFKYASAHAADAYSGALAIVGGLLIGDMAINLEWTSNEVLFYGAATMLASLGIANVELADAVKMYRLFLVLLTGFFPRFGFPVGLSLVLLSLVTTPVFGEKSYFWPLFPFHRKSLKTLLFRAPTFKAQPENQKPPV